MAFPAQLQATLNTLVADPQARGVFLAGLSSNLAPYSGILRTADGGATWQQVADLRGREVRAIAFKRLDSQVIAAGTDIGVFLSRDGGATWKNISPPENRQLRPVMSLAFDPKSSAVLYAGTPHLPWMTWNGGISWRSIATGMLDDSDIFAIQVDRNRPQRVFASACSGIYRSLDGGQNWTRLTGAKDASDRTYVISQDPQYENVWFAGTTAGLIGTGDGGTGWSRLGPYTTRSIAFDPGRLGRMFIATDQAGILRSDNGGKTWQRVNRGFCSRHVTAVWTDRDGVYATVLDNPGGLLTYRLKNDLSSWQALKTLRTAGRRAIGPGGAPVAVDSHTLLAATSSGLRASADKGASWHAVPGELGSDSIQVIYRHPDRPNMVFAAKFGIIYSSADAGRTWKRISPQPWPTSSVRQLAVLPGSPERLLVLTEQQGVWALDLEPAKDRDSR